MWFVRTSIKMTSKPTMTRIVASPRSFIPHHVPIATA
jgi:hypothetical protein